VASSFRPEGHLFLCGITPPTENAPDDFSLEVDYELFDEMIWPVLATGCPASRSSNCCAVGRLYEYNTFDHSGLIGRHPELANFIIATGFSGHGMMHAPATGAGVSDLVTYGEFRAIDLSPFGLERINAKRTVRRTCLLTGGKAVINNVNAESFPDIRDAVRRLCADFPARTGSRWIGTGATRRSSSKR